MRAGVLTAVLAVAVLVSPAAPAETGIEVFTRPGCPRCAQAEMFLDELQQRRPALSIVRRDISVDAAARARLEGLAAASGIRPVGVPAFHVGGVLVVGWRDRATTGQEIERRLGGEPARGAPGADLVCPAAPDAVCPSGGDTHDTAHVPLFGALSARRLGLPLFTVTLGLVDGFNPCAMWVLIYLLAILAGMRRRRRMIAVAGTFVVISGLLYFAFMAAWFNLFRLVGLSRRIEVLLGLVSLAVAILNLKDAVAVEGGPSLSIPKAAKPGLYARVRRIVHAESVGAAVAGAMVLALVVNAFELLCTAGLPAAYTHVLAARALPAWQHYAYLALYNLAYILDDVVMVTIAVVTLSRRRLQERGGRVLKGLSGTIMLILALLLLAAPGWLR